MIKKSFYILIFIICISCSYENANGCFQTAGSIIEKTFTVSGFTAIQIEGEVSLTIKQGAAQEVKVETGKNLMRNVYVDVIVDVDGETLIIRDENTCNFVRDYGITKVFVTTPNLNLIRNSSSYDVTSDGILSFHELFLVSTTDGSIENVRKGGDFYLNLDCERLVVQANGQSVFYLSGITSRAHISFTDEAPRFEGAELQIDDLTFFTRSANKIIVNPQNKIEGEIRGTGDVIAVNEPPIVEVEQFFTGQLIFQD